MRRIFTLFAAGGLVLLGAQQAAAQAVQLPTFNYFSVDTTVSVPDRGSTVLGGVNRASSGSTTRGFGPLRNRAIGSNVGASTASVHATIIDLDELDREVLAEAARRRELRGEPLAAQKKPISAEKQAVADKAAFLSRHVGKNSATRETTRGKNVATSPERELRIPR